MEIDIYYRNKETGKFKIFHEVITEEDFEKLAKEKTQPLPIWMDEDWEYDDFDIET